MKRLFFYVCLLCLISCQQGNLGLEPEVAPEQKQEVGVKVVDGILVFPDQNTLQDFIGQKQSLGSSFVSQQDVFDAIVEAESQSLVKMDETGVFEHSALYSRYMKEGFIKKVKYSDGTECYDLNSCEPYYARVANKDGFFAIGNVVYQVTPDLLKMWKSGDIANRQKLAQVTETDEVSGIYVVDYKTSPIQTRTTFPIYYFDQKVGIQATLGNNRYMAIFYDNTKPIIPTQSYQRSTYVRVVGQQKVGNTNTYAYQSFSYTTSISPTTLMNGVTESWNFSASGVGSSDWYTVYLPYKMMVSGKEDVLSFNDEYCYLTRYILYLKTTDLTISAGVEGIRNKPTSGGFDYYPDGGSLVTEIPD